MSVLSLLLIGAAAAFSLNWLIGYHAPIYKKWWGKPFSPRLMICKLLRPFDITMNCVLICGGFLGITTALGIGMVVYNVAVGLGLSCGLVIMNKFFIPRWKEEFERLKANG